MSLAAVFVLKNKDKKNTRLIVLIVQSSALRIDPGVTISVRENDFFRKSHYPFSK
jgi:hypothetical protein